MRLSSKSFVLIYALCGVTLLVGCDDGPPQSSEVSEPAIKQTVPLPAAKTLTGPVGCVFDVSALVELTADQVKAKLDKPLSDQQESIDEQVHSLRYRRRGYDLAVEYEVKSHRLVRFYVDPHKIMKKSTALLQALNINQSDKRYSIQYIGEENGVYNGILIIPKNARVQDEFGHWVPRDSAL